MRENRIGCFSIYIPYAPVSGSLNIPSSGVAKVNTTNKTAITESSAKAALGEWHGLFSSLKSRVS